MGDNHKERDVEEELNRLLAENKEQKEAIKDLIKALEAAKNFLPRFAYPRTYMVIENAIERHRGKQQK